MIERNSETWRTVAAHIEIKLNALRLELERDDLSEPQSAIIRGQIKALRQIEALGQSNTHRPTVPPQDNYGMGETPV